MRCPFCAHDDSQVKDSRPTEDGTAIRRRRQCEGCGARFTTFERVQLRELTVVKKRRQARAVRPRQARARDRRIACRKRDVEPARIDQLVSGIQRQIETRAKRSHLEGDRRDGDGRPEGDSTASPTSASPASTGISARPRDFEEFAEQVEKESYRPATTSCCERQQPVIVLVRPQLGENIGKAARAMLNFGLTEMRLVAPRDGWPNPGCRARGERRRRRAGAGAGLRHACQKRSPIAPMSTPPPCASAA